GATASSSSRSTPRRGRVVEGDALFVSRVFSSAAEVRYSKAPHARAFSIDKVPARAERWMVHVLARDPGDRTELSTAPAARSVKQGICSAVSASAEPLGA